MLNNLAGRIRRATYSGEKGNELSSTNTTANSRRLTDAAAVNHVPEVYFPPPPDPAPLPSTIQSSKSTLYLIYDNANPPPKRSGATRFVCISDTHSQQFAVPDGDVLLHSGDLTSRGKKANFEETLDWLISLPHKIKIIIAGNHDLPLHKDWYHENYERFVHHRHEKENWNPIYHPDPRFPRPLSAHMSALPSLSRTPSNHPGPVLSFAKHEIVLRSDMDGFVRPVSSPHMAVPPTVPHKALNGCAVASSAGPSASSDEFKDALLCAFGRLRRGLCDAVNYRRICLGNI